MSAIGRTHIRPCFGWWRLAAELLRSYPICAGLPLVLVHARCAALFVVKHFTIVAAYPVSLSRYGLGRRSGSLRTPLGAHIIERKVGEDLGAFAVIKGLKCLEITHNLNPLGTISKHDAITSRVMTLSGLERGVNSGGSFDSSSRLIYLHGTRDEKRIGRPSSMGCVRMKNTHIMTLFDTLPVGTLVYILR